MSWEKAMAPHSSTLAWKIPWMEELGRLQSMGSQRVRHNWATCFHFSFSCIREGNGNPLQCSCLENPRDGGAVYGVAQSQTWLKQLSSSSTMSWDHSCASPRDLGEGCYVIKVLGKYMGTSYRELLTLSYLSQWLSVNLPYASSVNGLATETL